VRAPKVFPATLPSGALHTHYIFSVLSVSARKADSQENKEGQGKQALQAVFNSATKPN
jgi:hypothetical protein